MGQHLSEPVTSKDTQVLTNSFYYCTSSSMQGWRTSMEDVHTNILSLKEDKEASFFSVFDGHGGSQTASFCGSHLHEYILAAEEYQVGDYESALKAGFLKCDKEMQSDPSIETSGAAAVCVLLKDGMIYCANSGDSRAIVSLNGTVQELSFDHKPINEGESKRIVNAGGWVEFNRVNGNLALSRAMGDFVFKSNKKLSPEEQIVTAYPDVIMQPLLSSLEFIVLACDGIWDVMSSQEVVDFVRCRIANGESPPNIVEKLLDHCLAPDCQMGGLGCDNMTVVLVCLLNEKSLQDLAEKCSKPPEILPKTKEDVISLSSNAESEEEA